MSESESSVPREPASESSVPREPASESSVPREPASESSVPREPASESSVPRESASESSAPVGDAAPILLQVRPRRITIWAVAAASVVVAAMVVIGLLLRDVNEGVQFRTADQVALIGVGLVLGGAILTVTRPRLRVDRQGLWIRNMLGEELTEWALVLRVSYPVGAPWAQLLMPDDEVKPIMAIQAMDRGRAVAALQKVRDLQATYGLPQPEPRPSPVIPAQEWQEHSRPLGRLEIIDREKAAERDRDLAAKRRKQERRATPQA